MSVAEGLRTAVPALVELREQGLVGAIGIAAGEPALVEEYIRSDMFDAVLTHNRYTLVDRSAQALIAAARERDMTVFNAAPFGGGILAGSPRRAGDYAYRPASPEVLAFVDRLRAVTARNPARVTGDPHSRSPCVAGPLKTSCGPALPHRYRIPVKAYDFGVTLSK
jgi:aryl-alcohol dehydrogenase-like predicted oxidoreductase